MALQPSKSGGSSTLSVTVSHPVLGLRDGLERVSRTACVTKLMYDRSDGASLAAALNKIEASVDKKVEGRPRVCTYYYISYEVVLDDSTGPGRPMQPSADGAAAGVVLAAVSERRAA